MTKARRLIGAAFTTAAAITNFAFAPVRAENSSPALTSLPTGYREWRLISVAHEEGKLNDIRAILGNDIAFKAAREGNWPYPDGSVIARLAWAYVASDENNKAFGQAQSFVAGAPTNVQFMVKDSKKYVTTGGWSYVQFNNRLLDDTAGSGACFACHTTVKARDYVFSRFSP